MAIPVARLNHAVLFVRDARVSAEFYGRVFGFEVGAEAPRAPRGSVGLYHLAWEVPSIEDLAGAARVLSEAAALGGASDHGVSKSLYGSDPDGNEFEIMWRVPRGSWGDAEEHGVVLPLDIESEVRRWGSGSVSEPD